jgi:UDP-GlcNAc:undecaprenyl-phosphate/decaprenyl-phosphate GlcNAc-1-phosphate transferase
MIRIPYSLILAVCTMAATLLIMPWLMAWARRIGALDHPGPRRVHQEPVPTMGGLVFALAVLGGAWLARVFPGPAILLEVRPLVGITLASIPILALGITDDLRGTPPWAKLGVQACAGLVLYHFGLGVPTLTNPLGDAVQLGWLNAPLTVVWVLIVINAVNLIDGLDGLASGVVLIACVTLWWAARSHGDFYVMFFSSLMIGTLAGFLRFNFPPARVFMGDTGSQFLGLMLAAVSLLENRKGTATVTLLFPLVALALPIFDSALAFFRRATAGRHVFQADSEHIHHRLLRLGLTHRQVTLLLWALSGLLGLVAVLLAGQPRGRALLFAAGLGLLLFVAFERIEIEGRKRLAGRRAPPTATPRPQDQTRK